jgi:hypothetical protein
MTTYTATFYTNVGSAEATFKAKTPAQALKKARACYATRPETLYFDPYESDVEEIVIRDESEQDVARWQSDDLHVLLTAVDLLDALETQTDAAQNVIDTWQAGDLAGAVRALDVSIDGARAAIAKAKGGGS